MRGKVMSEKQVLLHLTAIAAGKLDPTREQMRALELMYKHHTSSKNTAEESDSGIYLDLLKSLEE